MNKKDKTCALMELSWWWGDGQWTSKQITRGVGLARLAEKTGPAWPGPWLPFQPRPLLLPISCLVPWDCCRSYRFPPKPHRDPPVSCIHAVPSARKDATPSSPSRLPASITFCLTPAALGRFPHCLPPAVPSPPPPSPHLHHPYFLSLPGDYPLLEIRT